MPCAYTFCGSLYRQEADVRLNRQKARLRYEIDVLRKLKETKNNTGGIVVMIQNHISENPPEGYCIRRPQQVRLAISAS